jgi:hypothetical protein
MSAEDEPREVKTLTIDGTIYGEDYTINYLARRGKTEKTSGLLASLFERLRRSQAPGDRQTSAGNTLRLVKDEPIKGEVVDHKKEQ